MKGALLSLLLTFAAACGEAPSDSSSTRDPSIVDSSAELPPSQDQRKPIDDIVESFRAAHSQPAMAAAVVRSGEIIALSELGARAASTGAPVEPGDRWNLGGVTTSIMATVMAKLVERGDLSWDTRIVEVFADLAGKVLPAYEAVTLRDLLSHRAGLLPFTSGSGEVEIEINNSLTGDTRDKRRQFVAAVFNQQPVNVPGTTFEFSNAGFTVAAAMVEKILDKPLPAVLEELVFDPLSMESGVLSLPATVERPDQPWGHHPIREQLIAVPPSPTMTLPEILEPSNGVSCSIEDLAKFAGANLHALRGEEVEGIDAAIVRELHEVVIDRTAMGWFKQEIFGEMCHFNRGSSGLFYCWVMIWPEQDLAIVTTSNAGNGEEACRLLAEALFGKFREE